jgi:hypothetical protein
MKKFDKNEHRIAFVAAFVIAFVLLTSSVIAQQRRGAPAKRTAPRQAAQPAPTFDSLLAADSYRIYGEVRGVGGLIRSPAIKDLLDPVFKLTFGGPPKEFKATLKWLNAHSDVLAGSRMMVAAWPARPKLPTILIAIEFSSAEEAQKFEPELRGFIPTLIPPTPTPTPDVSPAQEKSKVASPKSNADSGSIARQQDAPAPPPYQIKQAGSLILMSDQPFALRDLAPRGSKSIAEDQNFAVARNRFASEAVFLYVDVKSIEKEERERLQKAEEEAKANTESEAANPPIEESNATVELTTPIPDEVVTELPPVVEPDPSAQLTAGPTQTTQSSPEPNPMDFAFTSLYGMLFGGQAKWPEAVGAAIAFEGDSYIVRTLIVNSDENKNISVPFMPQFISGPPLVPAASSVLPADVELFVSVSLDYQQIYQGMLKVFTDSQEASRKFAGQNPNVPVASPASQPDSPFASLEKQLGIKIKDDLLPLLGNEIALAMPRKAAADDASKPAASPDPTPNPNPELGTPNSNNPSKTVAPDIEPIIAIAVKDKEAVKRLIPKMIESAGMKGANLFAQTERRGDAEIISYAGVFAYAFIGDFLVVSPSAASTRRVVDMYLEHQTLSSDSHFRNSTRWQPRQVVGQFYIGPDMIERYNPINGPGAPVNEKMREFLSQLNPVIEPVTYALSNDGQGPFHELHLPKSLLVLFSASVASAADESPLLTNESIARSLLQTVASAEATFQSTKGDGKYGTLEELLTEGLISKDLLEKYGYKIDVTAASNSFEAIATPVEYGRTGRLSFFVDQSGVLRGGDRAGGAATLADKPID